MNRARPVVVYAASGYTGRLVCEALARMRVPFVAAGRSRERLGALVRELEGQGADCEARAGEHTPRGLRALLHGARVVVNASGPFSLLGREVVEAALAQGCHYVDTTGEQDFMLATRRAQGGAFARRGLLLAPSAAFLWAPGAAAAEVCLETPGIDSLVVAYAPPSLQTVASLQSMVRTVRRPGYSIDDRALRRLPSAQTVPTLVPRPAVRVAGGESVSFLGDRRVRAVDTHFASEALVRATPVFKLWYRLGWIVPGETLDRWGDRLVLALKRDPPAEEPESGRFVVVAAGTGGGREVRVTLRGTSPYLVTGFLCARTARALLEGATGRAGFLSLAQAFGAREVLRWLEEVGTTMTIEAGGRDVAA